MKKAFLIVWDALKRHKKKSILTAVLIFLYSLAKQGLLQKFILQLLAMTQKRILDSAKRNSIKEQKKVKIIDDANKILDLFLENEYKKSITHFSLKCNSFFDNAQLIKSLRSQSLTKMEKNKVWSQIIKNASYKLLLLISLKGIFDFVYFSRIIGSNSIKLELEKKHADNKVKLQNEIENELEILDEWTRNLLDRIFDDYISMLKAQTPEGESPIDWKYKLEEKIEIHQFLEGLSGMVHVLFEKRQKFGLVTDDLGQIWVENLKKNGKVIMVRHKAGYWDSLKKILFTQKENHSIFSGLIMRFVGYSAVNPDPQESIAYRQINFILDLLGTDFMAKFLEISRNYHLQKLHNRFLLFYKKDFSEEELFDEGTKIYLAKLISHTDIILQEEFYNEQCFEIDRVVLMQKLKLALYLKQNYEKTTEVATQNNLIVKGYDQQKSDICEKYDMSEKDLLLNQSFIGRINLDSPKTVKTTELFMKELSLLEAVGFCLKNLAKQINQQPS